LQTLGKGQFEDQPLVLKNPGNPYSIGVYKEGHGGSKCRIEVLGRSARFRDPLLQFGLAGFESLDAALVGLNERLALGVSVHYPVNELDNLGFDLTNFGFPTFFAGLNVFAAGLRLVGQPIVRMMRPAFSPLAAADMASAKSSMG